MKKFFLIFLFSLFHISNAHAKVGDPKPITIDGVTYRTHSNYVEAVKAVTEDQLWRTVLGEFEPDSYDPNLEEDVQWHIVCCLKVEDSFVQVEFNKVVYQLDKKTGKII